MTGFTFGSVCSGIEAASVAFDPLGWKAAWLAEIEAFPSAVLSHHYPDTPNLGDMTTIRERVETGDVPAPDLLCGGTPCQSFSVAGLRKSLGDARGNLSLEFIRIADAIDRVRHAAGKPPAWVLWENVPGVLSTSDNAFGAFLGGLCGGESSIVAPDGGWPRAGVVAGPSRVVAWRVLDAQFFGLAQRRQRVFVLALGGTRGWAAADALLPVSDRMSWHPAPSRKTRQGVATGADGSADGRGVAGTLSARTDGGGGLGTDFELGGGLVPETSLALTAARGQACSNAADLETFLPHPVCMAHGQGNAEILSNGGAPTLTCNHEAPIVAMPTADIVGTITSAGGHAVPGNTVQDAVAHQLIPMRAAVGTDMYNGRVTGDVAATLSSQSGDGVSAGPSVMVPAMVFKPSHFTRDKDGAPSDLCPPLSADADKGDQDPLVLAPTIFTGDGVGVQPYSIMPMNSGKDFKARPTDVAQPLMAGGPVGGNQGGDIIVQVEPLPFDTTPVTSKANVSNPKHGDPCHPLAAGAHAPAIAIQAGAVRENPESGPDGVGVSTSGVAYTLEARAEVQAVAFKPMMGAAAGGIGYAVEQAPTISTQDVGAVAFQERGREDGRNLEIGGDVAFALTAPNGGGRAHERNVMTPAMQVRRLTPRECERLQGFPDDYTLIPWRGKPADECPDGPRYKALGNSWAVPCARWIGQRITLEMERSA